MKPFKSPTFLLILSLASVMIFLIFIIVTFSQPKETATARLNRLESVAIECDQTFTDHSPEVKKACGDIQVIANAEYICSANVKSANDCWVEDKSN